MFFCCNALPEYPFQPSMRQDIAVYHEGSAATYSRTVKKAKGGQVTSVHMKCIV